MVSDMIDQHMTNAIAAALNAPTLGADGSIIADYITDPDRNDDDWKAIGGYPEGLHHSYAAHDWHWHIVQRILEVGIASLEKQRAAANPQTER